jgi:hypothetical protein
MPTAKQPLRIELSAGEVLFREGEPPTTGFLLESGEIEIAIRIRGQPIVLSRLRAGDILGEMGVFDGAPRSATATASATACCCHRPQPDQRAAGKSRSDHPRLLEGQVRRYRGAIQAIRGVEGLHQVEPDTPPAHLPATSSASRRTCAKRSPVTAGRALPADPPCRQRSHRRLRGAGAMEPSGQGPISPLQFVGLAEESQLIVPLGEYVFDTACKAVRCLQDAG